MKMLSLLLLLSSLTQAMEFSLLPTQSAPGVGQVDVIHNQSGFFVVKDGFMDCVNSHNIDPQLRSLDMAKIKAFSKLGCVKVSQNDKQEYILRIHGKIKGGGPILATGVAIGVRAVGYGTLIWGIISTGGELLLHTAEIVETIEVTANTASAAALIAPTP